MTYAQTLMETEAGFVDVLTTEDKGVVYGYRLTGASPGPVLLVAGHCAAAERIFERILSIPTLRWMRGSLILLRLELLDDLCLDNDLLALGSVDRTFMLPMVDPLTHSKLDLHQTYHRVLQAAAGLGMISGRGVASPIALKTCV
ncbi:MAG: hypothetical protein ACU0GG_12615 [Paracoccaceae bacterium]